MKNTFYILVLISFIGINNLKAQATGYPIATLEHNGTTTVYYGVEAFHNAYDNANNGDTIYLSADNFRSYWGFYKTIHVFGAGSSDPVTPSTNLTDWCYLYNGSDSTSFEGVYTNIQINGTMQNIQIRRCRFDNIQMYGSPVNTLFENNIIVYMNLNWVNGNTLTFRNNLFLNQNWWSSLFDNASNVLFENNTFYAGYPFISSANNCYFRNNIIYMYNNFSTYVNSISTCVFERNLINEYNNSGFNFGDTATYNTSVFMGNYYFVNANLLNTPLPSWGGVASIYGDFHLISPQTYPGNDSTQVGMYGGVNPFKEHAVPSNPHIVSKTIPFITNTDGTLPVNIKVKAQNY